MMRGAYRSGRSAALLGVALLVAAGALAAPAAAVSGGTVVSAGQAPGWLVTLATTGSTPLPQRELCGGVLIAPTTVATAAHCVDRGDPTHLEVHVGGSTLSTDAGRIVPVRGFATHPAFRLVPSPDAPNDEQRSGAENDVAVVELLTPVRGVAVLPVARTAPPAGATVTVYGHGLIAQPPTKPPTAALGDALRQASLTVIGDGPCRSALGSVMHGLTVLCAQSPSATVCPGDSGGPLVRQVGGRPELVGITSFAGEVLGHGCGEGVDPGGFADVAALRSWMVGPHPVLAPAPTGPVRVTGTKKAGNTLTCALPPWRQAPASLSYVWDQDKHDGDFEFFVPIAGQTRPTLRLTAELAAHHLLCLVTARTSGGIVDLNSDPV